MFSLLNIKVAAGAVALITGIVGGAYVAGVASPGAQTPGNPVVGSATPSRVASPSSFPIQRSVSTLAPRPSAPTHNKQPAVQAKHHSHDHHEKD